VVDPVVGAAAVPGEVLRAPQNDGVEPGLVEYPPDEFEPRHPPAPNHDATVPARAGCPRLCVACSLAIVTSQGGKPVDHIQVTATFPKIAPDNLAEFKRLAGEAVKVAADESGVLQYDWFFSADETACVVRETFENSDAILTHLGNVGDILGPVVQLGGGLELEMFGGSPSDQLVQALAAFGPTYYPFFQGK
jgi:hypothetical protein